MRFEELLTRLRVDVERLTPRQRRIAAGGGAVVILLLLGWACLGPRGGVLAVAEFPEAEGLKPGAEVTLRGVNIGKAQSIRVAPGGRGVEVYLRLEAGQARNVPGDSRAAIRGGGALNPFAGKRVEIIPPERSTAGALRSGGRLRGLAPEEDEPSAASRLGGALARAGSAIAGQLQQTGQALEALGEELTRGGDGGESVALKMDLTAFVRRIKEQGDAAAARAQAEWPALRERLEHEKGRLQAQGRRELAGKMAQLEAGISEAVRRARAKAEEFKTSRTAPRAEENRP